MLDIISREDMPEGVLDIVDIVGIDAFKDLVRYFGGTSLYIPNEVSLIRGFRNRYIRENFDGDYLFFARRFGISEAMVRIIVNGK